MLGAHAKEVEKMFPDSWNNLNLAEIVEDKAKEMDSEVALASWFYRAVDEAAGRRENGFDPFRFAKFAELSGDASSSYITDLSIKLLDFADYDDDDDESFKEALKNVIELCLWGTREHPLEITTKDRLSAAQINAAAFASDSAEALIQTRKKFSPRQRRQRFSDVLRENRRLIQNEAYAPEVDVLTKVVSFLCTARASGGADKPAMHIVTENVGHGLIADLLLGHMLLSLNIAAKVHYHSKPFSCGTPYRD